MKTAPLSNLFKFSFCWAGNIFSSSECAYQYEKALFHNNFGVAQYMITAYSGLDAKRHSIPRKDTVHQWDLIKYDVMFDILQAKFQQLLMLTGKYYV